jgi:hypothetical protein
MKPAEMHELWSNFKDAFVKSLDVIGKSRLEEAWADVRVKTIFYKKDLMPEIARHLGMNHKTERLRRDHSFLDANHVPMIVVECENQHGTAWQEVESLCSLAAPLKVLVLSCEWQASEQKVYLPIWTDIIRKHHAVISLRCLYAIVVGEWLDADSCVEYSFTSIDHEGKDSNHGFYRVTGNK